MDLRQLSQDFWDTQTCAVLLQGPDDKMSRTGEGAFSALVHGRGPTLRSMTEGNAARRPWTSERHSSAAVLAWFVIIHETFPEVVRNT